MSEEEIIEIIEKIQCEYKEQENDKKYYKYIVLKAKEYSKGLQGLLDLYNKEKEKNKELYEQINKLQEENECFKIASQGNFAEAFMKSNYISKDKIKEKIEELEQDIEIHSIYEENWNKIEILQELLEERN